MMSKWDQITAQDNTPPTWHVVSEWVIAAYDGFPPNVIQNTWTKNAWFDMCVEVIGEEVGEDKDDDA